MNNVTQYGYSNDEKLEVIEHLVEQWRFGRAGVSSGDRAIYLILKAIASDYRARDLRKITATILRFERALENAHMKKKPVIGYEAGNLREIAELLIGSWPVVRQALEDFEKENANG